MAIGDVQVGARTVGDKAASASIGSATGTATLTGIAAFLAAATGTATVSGSTSFASLGSSIGVATVAGVGIAMPLSSPTKFNSFDANLANGGINLGTDTLKIMLTNSIPAVTNQVYADVQGIEITGGNGYTTGGNVATRVSSSQTAGFYTLVLANWVLNAGGNVGPFRFLVLYSTNTSLVPQPLMVWWDFGSPVTLSEGGTFTANFDPILGAINMQ